MTELGTTSDPRALVPGKPEAIEENLRVLRGRAQGAELAADGLRQIDTGAWTGAAAEAFHHKFSYEPGKWFVAADALHVAADALDGYASSLRWAQQQAEEAIHLWDQGQAATHHATIEYQQAMTQAGLDNQPAPIFVDPGGSLRQEAQQILDRAKAQLAEIGEIAAQFLRQETAGAPEESSWLEDLGDFLGDTASNVLNGLSSWG